MRGRLLALIAALFVCGALPAGADAADTGVVPDITWGTSRQEQDRTAADLQEVGAGWVRLSISWSDWVEPNEGSYDGGALSHFDRGIDLARGAGYRVIVMVEESPSWAHDGSNKNSPPRNNSDLATFMRFLAARYVGKVEAYQVWNEPNLSWAWPSGPDPHAYARMLRDVAPAIRAADPSAKVLFAGLSKNDYEYLEGAYDEVPDLGRYFDVMASHPYTTGGAPPEAVTLDPNGRINKGSFSGYRELRRTMEARGDVNKPIWFTEFGWSTTTKAGGVSPETQAAYLTRAYNCLEQDPYVQLATWYNFRNEFWENDSDNWVTQLGLLSTTFDRKPAFDALKNYVPGAGGCAYEDPNPPPAPEPTPEPTPEPIPEPAPVIDTPDEIVSSSRRAAMLVVRRAQIRRGRLNIAGHVARGTTGRIRGVVRYNRRRHRFATRIDRRGRIQVSERLPGGRHASTARVALVYPGSKHSRRRRVFLHAGPRSARLRVQVRSGLTAQSESGQSASVSGTVVRRARGSLVLRLSYRTADGSARSSTARTRVRHGGFRRSMELPSDASNVVLQVVFAGDTSRGISGSSAALDLH